MRKPGLAIATLSALAGSAALAANLTLSAISPAGGPLAGGTTLTITGSGFSAGDKVAIGQTACTNMHVSSATTLTCVAPAKTAGTYELVVTDPIGDTATLSEAYQYNPAPTIVAISPKWGFTRGGTDVTITGSGFLPGSVVSLGGSLCAMSFESEGEIDCVSSKHAKGTVAVVVTNFDTQSGTLANGFKYIRR